MLRICAAMTVLIVSACAVATDPVDLPAPTAGSPIPEDCDTPQQVESTNRWGPSNRLGRYTGDEAILYLELIAFERPGYSPLVTPVALAALGDSFVEDVIVWADTRPIAFVLLFKEGCWLGQSFLERGLHTLAAKILSTYRQSSGRKFYEYLPEFRRTFYLAKDRHANGFYVEAEGMYRTAQQQFKLWSFGKYDPSVSIVLTHIAALYQDQQRYEEAEQAYKAALESWRASGGVAGFGRRETQRRYAVFLREVGRIGDAEAMERLLKSLETN